MATAKTKNIDWRNAAKAGRGTGIRDRTWCSWSEIARLLGELRVADLLRSRAVEAGGGLLMRPLMVHGSSQSGSKMPRRILHIEYGAERMRMLAAGLELAIA